MKSRVSKVDFLVVAVDDVDVDDGRGFPAGRRLKNRVVLFAKAVVLCMWLVGCVVGCWST